MKNINKKQKFQPFTQVQPIMGGDYKPLLFWRRANTYKTLFQHSKLPCNAAFISPALVSPATLGLHLQKNPVDTRQIRNCWPRRLPPPRKAQMVPRQKPDRLIRCPLAAHQSQKRQKENMDAPRNYSYPKTHGLRPHKPQRSWQSKGKPTSRNHIPKPLQPHQEKNKNSLKIQRSWVGQNSKKVESQNSA